MNEDKTHNYKSILLKFVLGLFLALAFGFALTFGVDALSSTGMFLNVKSDKSNVFIPLFLGVPVGSALGFVIIDRRIEKKTRTNWSGNVLGIISCAFLGVIASAALLDIIGGKAIFVIPIMMVFLALGGYQVTYKYN